MEEPTTNDPRYGNYGTPEAKQPPSRPNRTDIPSPQEFFAFIEGALNAVHHRLRVAGQDYGEEVLFLLGEWGAVSQCFTKASRLLWSKRQAKPPIHRKDSWLDLAGWAVLEIARQAYIKGLRPTEIDGLFDRSER